MHFSEFVEFFISLIDIAFMKSIVSYKLYGIDVDESSESFLGYETWVPKPPEAEKPRSTFNPASLAYLGDCIYEVCILFSIDYGLVVIKCLVHYSEEPNTILYLIL